jgi:hypothetical protein
MRKPLLALGLLAFSIFLPKPAQAKFICQDYGSCKICDFWTADGTYAGSISNCQ